MAAPEARSFSAGVPSVRGEEPLLIGLVGPPGGGKTVSALRLAAGMKQVRGGPVVLIDTEGGRSRKYSPEPGKPADPARLQFDFLRVDMGPPFRSHDFLAALKAQLPLKPAAIIVDCLSDEHEGEGGYLEWHDDIASLKKGQPGNVGGNEWAAWAVPKAARKRLISGLLQFKVPLLFTFRAREKTVTEPGKGGGRDKIVNIGWMPVAPLEIVHALDLTCILPPRADGVPVWTSEKVGEDFIVKLPAFLAPLVQAGQLSEATGAALARWAMGTPASGPDAPPTADILKEALALLTERLPGADNAEQRAGLFESAFGTRSSSMARKMPPDQQVFALAELRRQLDGLAAMQAERKPGNLFDNQPAEREPGED